MSNTGLPPQSGEPGASPQSDGSVLPLPAAGRRDNDSWLKWFVIAAVVVVVGAGAWYVWGYFNAQGQIRAFKEAVGDAHSQQAPNSPQRPEGMTADNASSADFYKYFTQQEQIDWVYSRLEATGPSGESVLQEGYNAYAGAYNKPGEYKYVADLVTPSESMSGDQILALDNTIMDIIARSGDSPDVKEKMLAAVVDHSSPNFSAVKDLISNYDPAYHFDAGMVSISAINNQPVESDVFSHTVLPKPNGYDPAGVPTIVFNMQGTNSSAGGFQNIYHFIDGKPILVKAYPTSSPEAKVFNPQDIHD